MEKTLSEYMNEGISPISIWVYSLEKSGSFERIFVLSRRYMTPFLDKYDPFRIRNATLMSFYEKRMI